MATKKTAPKATDILEKKASAAATRRENLSIFFMEGEGFRIEGTPEVVEHLTLRLYAEDAQGKTHLADVVPEHQEDGAFTGAFPELYADEEPETFAVCGVVMPIRSYTQDEYFSWLDLSKERGLPRLNAERRKLERNIQLASTGEIELLAAHQRMDKFTKEYDVLLAEEADDLYGLKPQEPGQLPREEKLSILGARIKDLRKVIQQNIIDPMKLFDEIGDDSERLEAVKVEQKKVSLEFVHSLATAEELTSKPFEAWLKRANGKDLDNAAELVDSGNEPYRSGGDAEPLNRKERRRMVREMKARIRELMAAAERN